MPTPNPSPVPFTEAKLVLEVPRGTDDITVIEFYTERRLRIRPGKATVSAWWSEHQGRWIWRIVVDGMVVRVSDGERAKDGHHRQVSYTYTRTRVGDHVLDEAGPEWLRAFAHDARARIEAVLA